VHLDHLRTVRATVAGSEPLRQPLRSALQHCTRRRTRSNCSLVMRWKLTSRRMPALFTRMCTDPKASTCAVRVLRGGGRFLRCIWSFRQVSCWKIFAFSSQAPAKMVPVSPNASYFKVHTAAATTCSPSVTEPTAVAASPALEHLPQSGMQCVRWGKQAAVVAGRGLGHQRNNMYGL
jgi:hypothetical protein